ncbi:LacI family transcriptional regulator [Loktanella sp. DSM 29012]|uniref:LacI family DNA-binding transcriptional regulator n=1 Tax=Loktanella sp. DSM 29012 TaxID=1881056 RepID=UPI0008D23DA4|nr:LacI family DNA-binding transcriptional regulator [Loktanella sp. DSM 29012]SEQ85691.1 LacI family transcriptional regulator [Loktanella sp. DSM 29012]
MSTIYDVAKAAGVSPKTVSRVLNGDAPVKAETAKIVHAVIAELGYAPSSAARAMRSNKSGLIGLITGAISVDASQPDTTGLPDLFIVQGVQKAMETSGKTLLIADSGGRPDRVPGLMRTFEQHRVEGIIYVADHHRSVSLPPVSAQTRLVLANCYDDTGTPCILPHDRRGQEMLIADLIAKGHRRIAYLTLNAELDATRLRTQGYRDALSAAGISYDPELVIVAGIGTTDQDAEVQILWDAIDRILSLDVPPTVICFGNDQMAMRAYGILRSRGLNLPDDISVTGYDNYRTITQTLYPTLTSVELPYHAMGVRATQLLLRMIDDADDVPVAPVLVSGPVQSGQSVRTMPTPITKLTSIGRMTQ